MYSGTVENWDTGTVGLWDTGTVGHWDTGIQLSSLYIWTLDTMPGIPEKLTLKFQDRKENSDRGGDWKKCHCLSDFNICY